MNDTSKTPTGESRIKTPDESTYKSLREFMDECSFSNNELGRKLSVDGSAVSKYFNRKFEGDIEKFESNARDVIKAHRARADVRALKTFHCKQSDALRDVCEQIRKTHDMGLIFGSAGVGKSCGVAIYAAENPSCIAITINRWISDYSGIEHAILDQIDLRKFKKSQMRPGDFLVEKFKRSDRLFIFDNAHRLTADSLRWIFDFHDATDCPIALVGNPEVLDVIRENDQMFSRIGISSEIRMRDPEHVTAELLKQFATEHSGDLLAAGMVVVSRPGGGHGRTLRKQLLLFRDLISTRAMKDQSPEKVFIAAGTQLVNGRAK